jgi:large subunit ribosomal protein L24|tara:strand:- start:263 stop:568 length:306 start_codon:yes stop_codon:yes gene_type:complete
MKIKKGDTVQVTTGNDAGKTGRVIKVYLDKDRIIVEGVNIVKKHARPTQDNPQGGIMEKEASIHISNIMLVVGGKPTRVGFKSLENGKKVKFAKSTGEVIN